MGFIIKTCDPQTKPTITNLLLSLAFGVLCLAIALCTALLDPVFLIANYYARIDYGTGYHEALSGVTDSVHLSAYLFNVTNAERFVSGLDDKLKVEEIGPFTYQENRTNDYLVIDKEAGMMSYTPRQHVTFLPEESVGDPKKIMVTMPNLAMLAMSSAVSEYNYFGKIAYNLLAARYHTNATVTMTADEYLWGYEDPLIQFGNRFVPGWISFDKLGILDRVYDKQAVSNIEVSIHDEDKLMIKSVNGAGGLNFLSYDNPEKRSSCNSFNDTYEGLGYPPLMSTERPIKMYRNVLCRLLQWDYSGMTTTDYGARALEFKMSKKNFMKIPENDCLCSRGTCIDGVSDLSECFYKFPLVLSNAHFLDADPALYERVEGMKPSEEEHGSSLLIDSAIGLVLRTRFAVQMSVNVRDVSFNSKVKAFSNMMVPVVHIKIVQPKVKDESVRSLRLIHVYGPYLILASQLVLVLLGSLLLLYSTQLVYWNWLYKKKMSFENVDNKDILCSAPLIYD